MSARLVFLLVIFLAVPAFSQLPGIAQQINQRVDAREQRISRVSTDPTKAEQNLSAVRQQAIHHDAEELSLLSASVQSDLQQLTKGMLAKDLDAKLKKLEKLSKKLRQEMNP